MVVVVNFMNSMWNSLKFESIFIRRFRTQSKNSRQQNLFQRSLTAFQHLLLVSLTSKKAQVSRKVKFERLGNGNCKLSDHWKLPTFSDLNSRASRNMPFFDVKDWMLVSYLLGNSTATLALCLELIFHAGQKSSSSMGTTELIIGQLFLPVCRL